MNIKSLVAALMLVLMVCLAGCESKTPLGPCVGVIEDRDPNLVYKLSVQNTVVGIIFSETVIVPVLVLANETFCPEYVKAPLK